MRPDTGRLRCVTGARGESDWEPPVSLSDGIFATVRSPSGSIDAPPPQELWAFHIAKNGKGITRQKIVAKAPAFFELQRSPYNNKEVVFAVAAGVMTFNLDSGKKRLIYENAQRAFGHIAFSPGGRYMYVVTADPAGGTNQSVMIYDCTTRSTSATFPHPTSDNDEAQWSETLGGFVTCFSSYKDKESQLVVLRTNGHESKLMTIQGQVDVALTRDPGTYVILHRLTQNPSGRPGPDDVFAYDPRSMQLTLLAHSAHDIHGLDVVQARNANQNLLGKLR